MTKYRGADSRGSVIFAEFIGAQDLQGREDTMVNSSDGKYAAGFDQDGFLTARDQVDSTFFDSVM